MDYTGRRRAFRTGAAGITDCGRNQRLTRHAPRGGLVEHCGIAADALWMDASWACLRKKLATAARNRRALRKNINDSVVPTGLDFSTHSQVLKCWLLSWRASGLTGF